ncbi:MAG: amidohydrolase family protein, partial [Candidatus Heimdallarchaeaceae archaeon]
GKRDIEIIGNYKSFDYIVHATYSKEEELKLLSKNKINIICCPISSLYNGLKFPPLELISENKILLGLGTDNVLFSNPDPFRLMAFTLYNSRSNNQNLSPKEVLKSVTVNPGLIVKKKIGQLEVGYSGDLLAIDLESNNLNFSKDVYTAITMRADQSDIRLQMYKGKVIKWKDQK